MIIDSVELLRVGPAVVAEGLVIRWYSKFARDATRKGKYPGHHGKRRSMDIRQCVYGFIYLGAVSVVIVALASSK